MYRNLKTYLNNYNYNSLYSNVIGLSRSVLALGSLLVLLFNKPEFLFKELAGFDTFIACGASNAFSLYCLVPQNFFYFNLIRWVSILILILVITGWRPRFTGVLHWWVAFSLATSATVLEGGEHVAQVLTLLLIPITLVDGRKNHWVSDSKNSNEYMNYIALISYIFIKIQMSVIYFNATVAKFNDSWLNGSALYYFFNDSMFGFNEFLGFLLDPLFNSILVTPLTWSVIVIEFILFLGFFVRKELKKYILVMGIIMHLSIAVVIGLYAFSIIMLSGLILYLHPLDHDFNFNKWRNKNEKEATKKAV